RSTRGSQGPRRRDHDALAGRGRLREIPPAARVEFRRVRHARAGASLSAPPAGIAQPAHLGRAQHEEIRPALRNATREPLGKRRRLVTPSRKRWSRRKNRVSTPTRHGARRRMTTVCGWPPSIGGALHAATILKSLFPRTRYIPC